MTPRTTATTPRAIRSKSEPGGVLEGAAAGGTVTAKTLEYAMSEQTYNILMAAGWFFLAAITAFHAYSK
jgi:hypothetical protein